MLFTEDELKEFSKDNIEHAIDALDRGDIDSARKWCVKQNREKNAVHDNYVNWVASLMTHIRDNWGDEAALGAIRATLSELAIDSAVAKMEMINSEGLGAWVRSVVDMWRQHGGYPNLEVTEDDEKVTIAVHCGSGGMLINKGAYEGPSAYARVRQASEATWGENDVPIYCTHCSVAHERIPIEALGDGAQLWVHENPYQRKKGDRCVHHLYKNASDIPAIHYSRLGLTKGENARNPNLIGKRNMAGVAIAVPRKAE